MNELLSQVARQLISARWTNHSKSLLLVHGFLGWLNKGKFALRQLNENENERQPGWKYCVVLNGNLGHPIPEDRFMLSLARSRVPKKPTAGLLFKVSFRSFRRWIISRISKESCKQQVWRSHMLTYMAYFHLFPEWSFMACLGFPAWVEEFVRSNSH